MKYFCKNCGGTNLYQNIVPKYCNYCGINFNLNKYQKQIVSMEQVEERSIIKPENAFKKISPKFELKTYTPKGQELGSILGVEPASSCNTNETNRPSVNKDLSTLVETSQKTREEILREFQQESSRSRLEE
jgi:hypothetical protein